MSSSVSLAMVDRMVMSEKMNAGSFQRDYDVLRGEVIPIFTRISKACLMYYDSIPVWWPS
jgi:hypothetical protein